MIQDFDLRRLVEPAVTWYDSHQRKLPWREDRDPYHIWVSEIMLQQTRVEAVIPYYRRFMEQLPDIAALASCQEDPLLKLWEGLGYYNRVRNMQKAAQMIQEQYEGKMPSSYEQILTLPGIGPYTAGAIASIAFDERVPAVDGNVLRILSRVTEDDSDIAKDATKKMVTEVLRTVMPREAGLFNQALMEIGALVCIPNGQPKCSECPWQSLCRGYANGSYDRLPVKTKAKARRIEKKTVLVIRDGEKVLLRKRPPKGLLAGLYEFPNLEGHLTQEEAVRFAKYQNLMPLQVQCLPEAKHIFSHIEWQMTGYMIRVADVDSFAVSESASREGGYLLVPLEQTRREYAVPAAFDAYAKCIRLREES